MPPDTPLSRKTDLAKLEVLRDRLLQDGLDGQDFDALLSAFGTGLNDAGIAATRIHVTMRTNNPAFGSIAHRWLREEGTHQEAFPRRESHSENWLQSPLFYLLTIEADELRQRLDHPEPEFSFPVFDDFRARGATDYILFKRFFTPNRTVLDASSAVLPEGCLMSITMDGAGGYSESDLEAIRGLLPSLLMSLKSLSNRQMAKDIAETYLGRDAGLRVLSGDIVRGSVERREAVICYFDLSGFTKLSEELAGDAIIAMLNAYFEVAVDIVHAHGGNVLKFMGDGMLAIFDIATCADANLAAIEATVALRETMRIINDERSSHSLPTTGFTLALHRGEVLYGNIGGATRLDFTVIGAAVNTTARLSGMCGHVDQQIVVSADVAQPVLDRRDDLVALGQYRLRGLRDRMALFTLD